MDSPDGDKGAAEFGSNQKFLRSFRMDLQPVPFSERGSTEGSTGSDGTHSLSSKSFPSKEDVDLEDGLRIKTITILKESNTHPQTCEQVMSEQVVLEVKRKEIKS